MACDKCMKSFHIESSPKTAGSKQINKRYSINVGAAGGGGMSTGGGQNEIMVAINVPGKLEHHRERKEET